MKVIARIHPTDAHGCRSVDFSIESGGDVTDAETYGAGSLYLRAHHAETFLRILEGASGAYIETDFAPA